MPTFSKVIVADAMDLGEVQTVPLKYRNIFRTLLPDRTLHQISQTAAYVVPANEETAHARMPQILDRQAATSRARLAFTARIPFALQP